MSPNLFLFFLALVVGGNFLLVGATVLVILRRTAVASAKCAAENRKEREATAAEYKALAERTTDALVQISVAIGQLAEHLPIGSDSHRALTRRMTDG